MEDFKKPSRGAREKFGPFIYLDAEQTAASLSQLEGGIIDELRSVSEEDSGKGGKIGGSLGYGPVRGEANLSKDHRARYEEEVLLKRTGYSNITLLLDKLRELEALGKIGQYSPEIYEQIEVNELYEFRAEIRLHPFHKFVSIAQGLAEFGNDWGMEDKELSRTSKKIEKAFYGSDKKRTLLSIFADMEGAEPDYKVAMAIKKQNLLVDLEELSEKATFVAQVQRKVEEGQKVPATRLLRKTPKVPPAEEKMMLEIASSLQDDPDEEIGLEMAEEDILLRRPAVIMKPLCIYRG